MPTEALPVQGHTDLKLSAIFRAKSRLDLFMVANFVNPFTTDDLPMSAYFLGRIIKDLPQSATFKLKADLGISATFRNPNFFANLPMKATFYASSGTTDLLSHATFYIKADLNMSATFIQSVSNDLTMYATFAQVAQLPMSATFGLQAHKDLRMKAFLGRYVADLSMMATFIAPGYTDFKATIIIQNYVAPKSMNLRASEPEIQPEPPNFSLLPEPKTKNQNTISDSPHILLLESGNQAENKE